MDDYSRATWLFLMQNKQQVLSIFQKFVLHVQTQFQKSLKIIRSDNGSEFMSQSFTYYLSSLGVIYQTSCPYTPQQNAKVERKHRHLLEMIRALRFQLGLPAKYWGECVLTTAHIINMLPTPVLNYKSHFQMLYNQLPDCTSLKAIGCLCFA